MKKLCASLFLTFTLAMLAGFSGCATPTTPGAAVLDNATAQRMVYDAEGKYKVALIAANTYVNLPLCSATVKPPCATLTVVRQIQAARPVARAALDAAQNAVRTPGFGADVVSTSVAAGTAAIEAFISVTNLAK